MADLAGRAKAALLLAAICDMTARSRLQARERAARETAETRLALLQLVLDELPTCVYFVTGAEARLLLANRSAVTLWGSEWPVGQPLLDFLAAHQIRLFDTNGQALPPSAHLLYLSLPAHGAG